MKRLLCSTPTLAFLMSSCALGLLWGWRTLAGNVGPEIFGFETSFKGFYSVLSPLPQAIILLAFGLKRLTFLPPFRFEVLFGVAMGMMSTFLFAVAQMIAPQSFPLFITSTILLSISYGVLLHAWIRKNLLTDFYQLLLRVLCASVIEIFLYLALQTLPRLAITGCAVLFIVLVGLSLVLVPDIGEGSSLVERKSKPGSLFLVSIGLSAFACGILLFSWIEPDTKSWTWAVAPLSILICGAAFALKKWLTPYGILGLLSGFMCVNVVAALFLSPKSPILSSLIFAGYWLLFAFSIAAATWYGSIRAEQPLKTASTGVGIVMGISFLVGLLGMLIDFQGTTGLVIAAVLIALALATALIETQPRGQSANDDEQVVLSHASSDQEDKCRSIAEAHGLTMRERDVFSLLTKGYSLKSISERLFISENTAKSHRRRIYLKLGVNSRQELIDLIDDAQECV